MVFDAECRGQYGRVFGAEGEWKSHDWLDWGRLVEDHVDRGTRNQHGSL